MGARTLRLFATALFAVAFSGCASEAEGIGADESAVIRGNPIGTASRLRAGIKLKITADIALDRLASVAWNDTHTFRTLPGCLAREHSLSEYNGVAKCGVVVPKTIQGSLAADEYTTEDWKLGPYKAQATLTRKAADGKIVPETDFFVACTWSASGDEGLAVKAAQTCSAANAFLE